MAIALAACAPAGASATVELETLNDSGVNGTVTLVEVGPRQTRVEVRVESGGNPDMPAHIHPGSCDNLVPQPKYPLQNVVNGTSTTVVPASLAELLAGDLAVNLHRANDDLGTYTACADLR
ncbi:MAG TPA: hypothetical protein VH741_03390 [Candidatus Limnocylindrales bacterium]|jgi:hypothetical protein